MISQMLTESNEHSEDEDANTALRRGFGNLLSQYIKHFQVLGDSMKIHDPCFLDLSKSVFM